MRPARAKTPERKLLTMMFVDIVSSSAMVAGRDPEDADAILTAILKTLTQAVTRYDGMIAQVLGDGLMAVFGAPDAKEDHALRACLAAQDIVRATANSDLPDFRVRVGISSGDVVARVVESGVWTDYRMVGECVHAAAKLQQRADPNTAQFSRDTFDLVPVGVVGRPVDGLRLTPDAEPIPAFALEGARAVRRTASNLLRSAEAPFLGREAEVATLFAMADQAAAGTASLLLVSGEAGIGKSRLAGEFFRDPRSRRWTILQWPQMPIRRLGDPDDLEAVALSLAVQFTGSAGGEGAGRIAAAAERRAGALAADAVRDLFGLPALDPRWSGLDPAQKLSLAVEGLVAAVLDLTASGEGGNGRPTLLLVEDVHWARPVMVRLLDALSSTLRGSGARLLLVATMRPPALRLESAPEGWRGPQGARRIDLAPLGTEQVQRFLDYWLGSDWSLVELKAQLIQRSQGVPLYLEELVRTLATNGALSGKPRAYRLADMAPVLNLPRSLHGLLAARMDLMEPEPRRVLMNAAVVGPTFDAGLLRVLSPGAGEALPQHLDYLERAGFILRARLLPNLEYGFTHALIREVAYATLTKDDRLALHARVLGALRRRADASLPNRADLLAHHAFMAEDWPAAYLFGRRAGERAEARSKLEDSSRHYANALAAVSHLPDTPRHTARRIDLLIALPRSLLPRGSMAVREHLEQAIALSREAGDSVRYAHACSMLASFLWTFGALDEGVRQCRSGLAALDEQDDARARVQLVFRLAGLLTDKGLFTEALNLFDQGARQLDAERPFDRYGLATVATVHMNSLAARALAEIGDGAKAVAAGHRSVEAAEDSRHLFSRMFALTHLGWTHAILGALEPAMSVFEEALSIGRAIHAPLLLPLVMGGLAHATVLTGAPDKGFALFADSFALFEKQGGGQGRFHPRGRVPQVRLWHAEALASVGRRTEAAREARDALAVARETAQLSFEARACHLLSRLPRSTQGSMEPDATAFGREAATLARRLSMRALLARCNAFDRV